MFKNLFNKKIKQVEHYQNKEALDLKSLYPYLINGYHPHLEEVLRRTLLGTMDDPAGGGTSEFINSGLSKSGRNDGGINALSQTPDPNWTDQEIWDNMNKPWLETAAQRGDVIRAISDPNIPANISNGSNLSFFGREHSFLTTPVNQGGLGYTYNPLSKTYNP